MEEAKLKGLPEDWNVRFTNDRLAKWIPPPGTTSIEYDSLDLALQSATRIAGNNKTRSRHLKRQAAKENFHKKFTTSASIMIDGDKSKHPHSDFTASQNKTMTLS
eukprot:CAMPEP_0194366974 /NCGR_PEP_ID=MMETSP0174-20130528/15101_1 /TAXON_ID=216777 /ORGANISM="Proboscia alata, Strain PI-D3" /LENGTH=104 /DNA_ID=CAMNT_0039142515 /DNA_START=236 /DNA_END=546 /DNA_ORIENTATION=-